MSQLCSLNMEKRRENRGVTIDNVLVFSVIYHVNVFRQLTYTTTQNTQKKDPDTYGMCCKFEVHLVYSSFVKYVIMLNHEIKTEQIKSSTIIHKKFAYHF